MTSSFYDEKIFMKMPYSSLKVLCNWPISELKGNEQRLTDKDNYLLGIGFAAKVTK